MKSSTLHRSNLSRERMSMIENVKPVSYGNTAPNLNQYIKYQKKPELDVLWRDFEKNIQPKTKAKAPIVYAGIGFVMGLLFSLAIAVIIGLSTYSDIAKSDFTNPTYKTTENAKVAVMPASTNEAAESEAPAGEEKYTIKAGDTLDRIAIRFYGKYDEAKINKIMEINNIKDPTRIQIDQVLIIPLD